MRHAPAALRTEVFEPTGRIIRVHDHSPGGGMFEYMFDLSDMPQGTYLLRLTDGEQTGVVRLSVVR
jgi:hypothetical protein